MSIEIFSIINMEINNHLNMCIYWLDWKFPAEEKISLNFNLN